MKHDNAIQELVNKWIRKAENDLISAEHELTFDNPIIESVCFHCQQSAEKFLKAFLTKNQIYFSRTHVILDLLKLCASVDPSFLEQLTETDVLTDYAIDLRYPDFMDEPDIIEAKNALELARKVKHFVLSKMTDLS